MTVTILHGDARAVLADLPADAFQTCVTSPPYFGQRDYGMQGQLGVERSPDEYVREMVSVFRQVRRTLRPDGTLWLNIGDTYARDSRVRWDNSAHLAAGWKSGQAMRNAPCASDFGAKPKDLLMIPARVALALQDDGWWLRSDIIWHKSAVKPESVKDRPTSAHEHVFLFAKSEHYYFDRDAIREPSGANARNVWTIAPRGVPKAHHAVMPEELAERCIRAGSRPGDAVFDPFLGAGTTGLVADRLGRNATGIELHPEYAAVARKRIDGDAPLLAAAAD